LKEFGLEKHIECEKIYSCKEHSLRLIEIYNLYNPEFQLEKLTSNRYAINTYSDWKKRKRMSSVKNEFLELYDV